MFYKIWDDVYIVISIVLGLEWGRSSVGFGLLEWKTMKNRGVKYNFLKVYELCLGEDR